MLCYPGVGFNTDRSFVAHDPRPSEAPQLPPGPLRSAERSVTDRRWRGCGVFGGGVASSGPVPADTRVRCTAKRCYASFSVDLRLLHGCKQAGSDPQPTHAPIKHGRKVSRTALPRVYYNAQVCVAVVADDHSVAVVSSPYTRYQVGTQHVEDILDRLRLAELKRAGEFGSQFYHTEHRERHSARKPTARTTLFADRNQRLEVMPPNALHTAVAYRNVQPRAQVISPGPVSKRVDSTWPPAES